MLTFHDQIVQVTLVLYYRLLLLLPFEWQTPQTKLKRWLPACLIEPAGAANCQYLLHNNLCSLVANVRDAHGS